MDKIPDNLGKVLEDIKYIRASIEQNGDFFRQIIYTPPYRILFWLTGISLIVFSGLYYYFIRQYGAFDRVPPEIRSTLIISTIAIFIIAGAMKVLATGFMKQIYPNASWLNLVIKLLGHPILIVYIIIGILMIYFSLYFGWIGLPQLIFPVLGIGAGILFSTMGLTFSFFELTLCGLILTFPAAASIPFILKDPVSVWIWVGSSSGTAFLTVAAIMEINLFRRRKKGKTQKTN